MKMRYSNKPICSYNKHYSRMISNSVIQNPPPPRVPEGWKAVWNDQYKEYFFVNLYTKKSQWITPTAPALPGDSDAPPTGPPPGYDKTSTKAVGPEKPPLGPDSGMSEDEKLARRLQDEENARAGIGGSKDRGEADSYYGSGAPPQYGDIGGQQSQYSQYGGGPSPGPSAGPAGMYGDPNGPQDQQKKGLFGKLFGKNRPQQYPQQYQQPYQQQPYSAPHGPPPGGYYGQQQQYAQPGRKSGIGAGGAAALGLGGGLLGGVLLEEAIDGHHGGGGYGGDDGGYGGDDGGYGGGDGGDGGGFGGGDGGGDGGGGDF